MDITHRYGTFKLIPSKFTLNALSQRQTVENSCLEKVNNVIARS